MIYMRGRGVADPSLCFGMSNNYTPVLVHILIVKMVYNLPMVLSSPYKLPSCFTIGGILEDDKQTHATDKPKLLRGKSGEGVQTPLDTLCIA